MYKCAGVGAHVVSVEVTGRYTADVTPAPPTTVIVSNALPVIAESVKADYATILPNVLVGQAITLTVPFSDKSPSDTHALQVVWGDGETRTFNPVVVNGVESKSITATHTFSQAIDQFNIVLTLRDTLVADGSEDSLMLPTTVTLAVCVNLT